LAHPRSILPVLLAVAATACSSPREPSKCHSGAECPPASRCSNGVCGAAPRPVAALRPITSVQIYDLVTLDGADSRDPGGGQIVDYRWSVASSGAACDPPAVAGNQSWTQVRFGCEGQYLVSLVVANELGLESEPLTTTIEARGSLRPSVISAGGDVARDHVCKGAPLLCSLSETVTLAARSTDASLTFRWSALPPLGRPLSAARRVRFLPDETAASPRVSVETDGLAISGDWIFRVEARDASGVVGAAFTRVSVTNRPPMVVRMAKSALAPHAFDAARSVFTAEGQVSFTVTDPDGDPVEVAPTFRHVGDGGATFDGSCDSSTATFRVEVPYDGPDDAQYLIGGEDLSRTVELLARDANGAEARASVPVVIGNRPPVLVQPPTTLTVPHRYDAASKTYVASADLGVWSDPDGDPIDVSGGVAPCDDLSIADGALTVRCSVVYEGVPAADQLVGSRSVPVHVRDLWDEAVASGTYVLTIQNSAPTLSAVSDPGTSTATFFPYFHPSSPYAICPLHGWWSIDAVDFTVTPTVSDPDGDPVLLQPAQGNGGGANPAEAVCLGGPCLPFRYSQPAQLIRWPPCAVPYTPPSSLSASDGSAGVSVNVSPAW
jgi:hypothetical protein